MTGSCEQKNRDCGITRQLATDPLRVSSSLHWRPAAVGALAPPTTHVAVRAGDLRSLLRCILQIGTGLFQIADALLNLAFSLLLQSLGLLLFAANQLADFLLNPVRGVLGGAFDLILVGSDGHDDFLDGWLKQLICKPGAVRAPAHAASVDSNEHAFRPPGPIGGDRLVT